MLSSPPKRMCLAPTEDRQLPDCLCDDFIPETYFPPIATPPDSKAEAIVAACKLQDGSSSLSVDPAIVVSIDLIAKVRTMAQQIDNRLAGLPRDIFHGLLLPMLDSRAVPVADITIDSRPWKSLLLMNDLDRFSVALCVSHFHMAANGQLLLLVVSKDLDGSGTAASRTYSVRIFQWYQGQFYPAFNGRLHSRKATYFYEWRVTSCDSSDGRVLFHLTDIRFQGPIGSVTTASRTIAISFFKKSPMVIPRLPCELDSNIPRSGLYTCEKVTATAPMPDLQLLVLAGSLKTTVGWDGMRLPHDDQLQVVASPAAIAVDSMGRLHHFCGDSIGITDPAAPLSSHQVLTRHGEPARYNMAAALAIDRHGRYVTVTHTPEGAIIQLLAADGTLIQSHDVRPHKFGKNAAADWSVQIVASSAGGGILFNEGHNGVAWLLK